MEFSSENLTVHASTTGNTSMAETASTTPMLGTTTSRPQVLVVFNYINYVYLPTVLIVGVAGNALSIIIMTSRRYSQNTSRMYLIALALSDSMALFTQPFQKAFFHKLVGMDLRSLSDIGCKIFFIARRGSKMTSSWFVVLLCVDRFIAVWFPLKAKLICTKRTAIISMICLYIAVLGWTLAFSWASKVSNNGMCYPDAYDRKNPDEVALFGRMVKAGSFLYSIIPMIILGVLSPMIVFKISRHAKKRMEMANNVGVTKQTTESSKITAMLLGIVVAFIVLVLPITVLHNAAYELKLNTFADNAVGFDIFKQVAQILEQLNHSINFFLYVLTSKKFRNILSTMFCKIREESRNNDMSTRISTVSLKQIWVDQERRLLYLNKKSGVDSTQEDLVKDKNSASLYFV